jgi:hypothetical protein
MHNHFGVAAGVEAMAKGRKFWNQLLEVVDLSVEDHNHRLIFVEQGLLPA